MNVLIFGSNGFIGRNFAKYLFSNGIRYVPVVRDKSKILHEQAIELETFLDLNAKQFGYLKIQKIVYAIGDPRLRGSDNREEVLLERILEKLKEFHFQGRFVLISSNAANPGSGKVSERYLETLRNSYILRKSLLEEMVLRHANNAVILRSPAVIGVDMNDSSHVKEILVKPYLANLMTLPLFRGSLEVLAIHDLCVDIQDALSQEDAGSIIEPVAPAYRFSSIARSLKWNHEMELREINVLNRLQETLASILPVNIRFLFFPHWISKCASSDEKLFLRHKSVTEELNKIKSGHISPQLRVLVTGCASGLGKAITEELIKLNYQILGIDRESISHEVIHGFSKFEKFQYVQGDLGEVNFRERICEIIGSEEITGIFSVAGIGPRGMVKDATLRDVTEVLSVNFLANTDFARMLLTACRKNSFFVYIGSSSGVLGLPNFSAYSASKSALDSYFFSLICELGAAEMKVLGLNPSGMKTGFQARNNVQGSKIDRYILSDPRKIASQVIKWSINEKKGSTIKYIGISSFLFLVLRNFPFRVRMSTIKLLSRVPR
jgi:short-subunit dehydrogenase